MIEPRLNPRFTGCITFWAVGCAFAVGSGNEYIGLENFFFSELDTHHFPQWFFQVKV